MPVTAILAGAAIDNYDWLSQDIAECDFIICADSGLRHARAINITPNIIIGDFDSVDPVLLNEYKSQSDVIHNEDQNSTDLMKALDVAPEGHEIHIYGAVGERADHDFSNYLILLDQDNCNNIILKTEKDERRIITKPLSFKATIGDMVGVFPLRPIQNLSYEGLQYPTTCLSGTYELGWNGSCNPVIADTVKISLDTGAALITRTHKKSL